MRCIICGCTENEACNHAEFGPCWWHNEEYAVCSHCAYPEQIQGAERAVDPNLYATALTPYILRRFFKALDLKVSVTMPSKKHASHGKGWHVTLRGNIDVNIFSDILEAHFEKCESTGYGSRFIDPTSMRIRKEAHVG